MKSQYQIILKISDRTKHIFPRYFFEFPAKITIIFLIKPRGGGCLHFYVLKFILSTFKAYTLLQNVCKARSFTLSLEHLFR